MSSERLLCTDPGDGDNGEACSFDFHPTKVDFLLPQLSVTRKKELVTAEARAWRRMWIVKWGRRKVVDPFIFILQRGLEPKVLSLSAAVGLTIGLFPICGVTMILCALSAVILRSKCHLPTLMLGNFVASVFGLGLLIPLLRVGELVTRGGHFIISTSGLWEALRGRGEPSHELVFGMLHAVIGWSIVAPFSIAILFVGFLPMFHYLTGKFGPQKRLLHGALGCSDYGDVIARAGGRDDFTAVPSPSNGHSTIIKVAET